MKCLKPLHLKNLILISSSLLFSACSVGELYIPDDISKYTNINDKMIYDENTEKFIININSLDLSSTNSYDVNEVVSSGIILSQKACSEHTSNILGNTAFINLSTGLVSLGLTGASAMTTHVKTATDLAIGATGILASKSLINKEVFFDTVAPTILKAINTRRDRLKNKILLNTKTSTYSVGNALIDLEEYNKSCSLEQGLVEIVSALEDRRLTKSKNLEDIKFLKSELSDINNNLNGLSEPELTETKKSLLNQLNLKLKEHTSITP